MSNSEQPNEPAVKPLNDRQRAVIDTLIMGRTISAAAKECGVARRTAHGWLADDDFQAALEARRREIADRVGDDIADVQRLALAIVKGFLSGETVPGGAYRIETAKDILFKTGILSPPKCQRDGKTSSGVQS
jgi:hypothetical protein